MAFLGGGGGYMIFACAIRRAVMASLGGVGVVDYQGKGLVGGIGRYEFFQAIVKYSKYK